MDKPNYMVLYLLHDTIMLVTKPFAAAPVLVIKDQDVRQPSKTEKHNSPVVTKSFTRSFYWAFILV